MAAIIQLNAGFATVGQGAGPMIVTERAGIFRKYGLEVNIRMMGGAVAVVRGLLGGEIQFGNLAAPALLRAVLEGKPDMVFLTGGINQQFLMTRPAITQREQLANGTIGMAGDKGLNDLLVHFIVEQFEAAGIQNVRKVPFAGVGHGCIEALLNGTCDALVITPPEALYARRMGCNFVVDFADYGLNYLSAAWRQAANTSKSTKTLSARSSRRTWKGCTVTEPTVTSPSEFSRNTAESKIVPLPRRPMI